MKLGATDWSAILDPAGPWSALVAANSVPDAIARHAVGLVYLTGPYAEGVTQGGRWRFERSVEAETRAAIALHALAMAGCTAVSPVVMWSAMAQASGVLSRRDRVDPLDAGAWARWCAPIRAAAGLVAVHCVPGWRICAAVMDDVGWALERNVPVHFLGAA